MTADQIVIVTQTDDPHADDVVLALERMGHDPVRLNTDEIPQSARISMSWDSKDRDSENGDSRNGAREPFDAAIDVLSSGRAMTASQVRSVWWRRPGAYALPDDLSVQEAEFASTEIEHALRGLWACLDCYWVSEPDRIRRASFKGEQLTRARRLGFEIPRTLITTDPERALQFFGDCGQKMIYKVMSDPTLGGNGLAQRDPVVQVDPYAATTTLITEADLDLLDSVAIAPCLFQEYVPKKLELRITVIGGEIFAAEIHSQESEETSVDWRHYDADIPYRPALLPPPVADRCLELVRGYGLNFSAIDMIVTPDDRYVFVENNPNGQFIFVEHKVPELAMTDALAACLVRGASQPGPRPATA